VCLRRLHGGTTTQRTGKRTSACGKQLLWYAQAPVGLLPARLPRHVAWTCDPSGKNERLELKKAGFNVRQGINAKAFGINLVTRWLRSGRLKIVRSLCPNLCSKAPRYHYAGARDGLPESEEPVNEACCFWRRFLNH